MLTLPQGAVMEALMGGLIMEATESLEPLLGLSAAFARDLQADFLPFFPRLMQRLARLISSGACSNLQAALVLHNHPGIWRGTDSV